VEAFRSLRTSILFSSAAPGGRSILVSSTGPGEGKTLVSCNLALALAMAGQRVLLVDADMRRPKVHDAFGRPLAPGLSNVLIGETAVSAAIRESGSDNLSILSAGTPPPNPPELLGSSPFAELLKAMSGQFDWVVLDSPPVRAVADAAIIAHLATTVVFVVGAEMTDVNSARSALERLVATQGRVAGAVLNRVQLRRHSYYYARYYNRADEHYYVHRDGRA
jgi:capsular exopolysaccharide synthesis family protein